MANPAVTYTFSNGSTADASQVNTNFNDIINSLTDGTKSLTIDAITAGGAAVFNGNVTLGNGSVDDLTINASLASTLLIKTTASYNIGGSTLGLLSVYFGRNSQTTRLIGSSSMSATYTLTLPPDAGTAGDDIVNSGSGTLLNLPPDARLIRNVGMATSVGSGALTIDLKGADGSDPSSTNPVYAGFRSSTATTGTPVLRAVTGALSLTVDSGATLGFASGQTHYLYVYLIDNAGTVELAVSGVIFDEGSLVSTTSMGTGSDSISVMYSETGRADVACKLIGRIKFSLTTAGTWDETGDELCIVPFEMPIVHAFYDHSTTMSVNATNRFYPDTKVIDTHNAVTTGSGTWVFTAPKAGYYEVKVQAYHTASPGVVMAPYLRGTSSMTAHYFGGYSVASQPAFGSIVTYCDVGETIWVDNATGSTTSLASISSSNWISITEVRGMKS